MERCLGKVRFLIYCKPTKRVLHFVVSSIFIIVFKVYVSLVGFLEVPKVILMVITKEKLDYDFFSWCNLRLKFGKITSGIVHFHPAMGSW